MRKSFEDILHPPELKGAHQWRYWSAVAGWLVIVTLIAVFVGSFGYFVAVWLETKYGTEFLRPYEGWALGIFLFLLMGSVFVGDYLWKLIFVRTGYLSHEAVIRIRTNRAPTARGERIHRRISLTLSLLIPIGLIAVGWYLDSWWMMALMLLVGVWLFISVWAGWAQADSMMVRQKALPQEEIKRVLEDLDDSKPRV